MGYKVVKIKFFPNPQSDVNILVGIILQSVEDKTIYFSTKQRGYEDEFKRIKEELLRVDNIEEYIKDYSFLIEGLEFELLGITKKPMRKIEKIFNTKFEKIEIPHPSVVLKGLMDRNNYSPQQLADLTSRNLPFIKKILNKEVDFTKRFVVELEKVFLIDQNYWLDLQQKYKDFYEKDD